MRRASALALALLASSCSSVTEIVVVVDTDIPEADTFRVTAVHPSGESDGSSADLAMKAPPRTLVLVHRGGALGPVHLTIEALEGNAPLVSVVRDVAFEEGRSLRLDVFLSAACRNAHCGPGTTCGNDGSCRSPVVPACEYEGSCTGDGGVSQDAAIDAAGGCALSSDTICGVSATHLPGDPIAPRPCTAPIDTLASVTGPGGVLEAIEGAFVLGGSGAYTVRLAAVGDDACAITRELEVAAPIAIPDSLPASIGELRDLAARPGTAFVAGQQGAWAIDDAWHALEPLITPTVPYDLRAVVVVGGDPIFGPSANTGAVYALRAVAPFDAVSVTSIALPPGSRDVRALDLRADGTGPVLATTRDGAVAIDVSAIPPTSAQIGMPFDPGPDGFGAIGADVAASHGAIWIGTAGAIVNRSTSGGATFASGAPAALPAWLVSAHDAEVDDRGPGDPRLWVCGDGGVALFTLRGDWTTLVALPAPDHLWSGACSDIALGDDGEAWVASGTTGLVRLDARAEVRARYDAASGLPASSVDHVAFAADAQHREVWMLDATAATRSVLVIRADARP